MDKNLFDYDLEAYLNLRNPQLKIAPPPVVEKNIFDCYEILVQKADYRRHGSDEPCNLEICGLILCQQ